MEIESDEDNWQPQQQNGMTIFDRIRVEYSDNTIEQNLERMMEVPNYYITEINEEDKEQYEDCIKSKMQQNEEAFYDPLEDDQNELWIKNVQKQNRKHKNMSISCPNCFGVVAENYEKDDEKYTVEHPLGVMIDGTKVIRNRESQEIMKKGAKVNISKSIKSIINGKINGLYVDGLGNKKSLEQEDIDGLEEELRRRQEEFNIKIVCVCSCGNEIGYFDVNKELYTFINVIQ